MRWPAPTALVLAVGLVVAAGPGCARRNFADERRVCTSLGRLDAARAGGDVAAERAATDRLRAAAVRSQNINLARYGQAYTSVPGSNPEPNALVRLHQECEQVGVPARR